MKLQFLVKSPHRVLGGDAPIVTLTLRKGSSSVQMAARYGLQEKHS